MFYDTVNYAHGLPHDPLKAIVAPRPIGWISAVSASGAVNLSPYSFFNAFSTRPPIVGFSSEGFKDAVAFISETREFVCNLATWDLRDAMNATSASLPRGQSEFAHAGLEEEASQIVKAPRIKGIAAALECRLTDIQQLKTSTGEQLERYLVLGHVVGVYIDERFIEDGLFDITAAKPIARCGYHDYAVVNEVFSIVRPS